MTEIKGTKIHIGTCSWKYPSWEGLVYSSREPVNFLAEYAQKYKSVEVDQWFWSLGKSGAGLPKKETVAEYSLATPSDFRFTIKCPNALTLTHLPAKKGEPLQPNAYFLDPEFFNKFLDTMDVLVPKVGLFIFQFGYLNQQMRPSKTAFFEELAAFIQKLPVGFPYALEIRNPKWVDQAWFDLLSTTRVSPVLLQGYWMDDVAKTIDTYLSNLTDSLCIRLHGEDREGMEERSGEDWSQIVRSKDDEIKRIMKSVRSLQGQVKQIYLNINNHYEGSAPRTIQKIEPLLFDDVIF